MRRVHAAPAGAFVAALVLLSTPVAHAAGSIGFTDPVGYSGVVVSGGGGPSELAIADFTGDGHKDFAHGNTAATGISIFRNQGDGTFAAPTQVPTGSDTPLLLAGDFDEDGHNDLAATGFTSPNLTVYRGGGDGTFTPGQAYAIPTQPYQLAGSDLNRDGHLDIAIVNGLPDDVVTILLGNGDGTFTAGQTVDLGAYYGLTIAAGDLNADQIPDLAVADIDQRLRVLIGTGDGTFQPPVTYRVGGLPEYIEIGDLDRDGRVDLVVANGSTNDLSLLYGTGNGAFAPEVRLKDPQSPAQDAKPGVTVADYDGDGLLDIGSVATYAGQISILQGVGGRAFAPAGSYVVGGQPEALFSVDLDGDGDQDVVAPGNLPLSGQDVQTRIWVLKNISAG